MKMREMTHFWPYYKLLREMTFLPLDLTQILQWHRYGFSNLSRVYQPT